MSPAGSGPPIDDPAAAALQDALAAEHAALWSYALAVAFLAGPQAAQARADAASHRGLRATLQQTLTGIGKRPVSAQPAYDTPQPVEDAPSAAALAAVAETDAMAAWRSVLERTAFRPLRQLALDTLIQSTLRCARWRAVVGATPAIPVFPGRP
jgi:hypothetical protein